MFLIKNLSDYFNKIISPPFCAYCRVLIDDYTVLCQNCTQNLKPIPTVTKSINTVYNLTIYSVSAYQDPIKSLILAKGSSNYVASKQIAYLIWHRSMLKDLDFDYFVPIALHWTRYASRGYNQSQVIAHELSRLSGKSVLDCVSRIKRTKFQSVADTPEGRKQNVSGAFELNLENKEQYTDKKFIIVDDLMTTGSTLLEVSKILTKLKPKSISAIVAGRAI